MNKPYAISLELYASGVKPAGLVFVRGDRGVYPVTVRLLANGAAYAIPPDAAINVRLRSHSGQAYNIPGAADEAAGVFTFDMEAAGVGRYTCAVRVTAGDQVLTWGQYFGLTVRGKLEDERRPGGAYRYVSTVDGMVTQLKEEGGVFQYFSETDGVFKAVSNGGGGSGGGGGTGGNSPYIGGNGDWYAYDDAQGQFADTGVKAQGPGGKDATVAVGTVTTGAEGSAAAVTNTGAPGSAVLNFTIPAGKTGATGAAATVTVGTVTTGAEGTGAAVTNTGTSSAAVLNFTIPAGKTGAAGAAATVSIGTTATGAAGSAASVTNTGTSSAAVLNFTIPRGASPVKGTDYWTAADLTQMVADTIAALPADATLAARLGAA